MFRFKNEENLVPIHRIEGQEYDDLYEAYEKALENLNNDDIIPSFADFIIDEMTGYDYSEENDNTEFSLGHVISFDEANSYAFTDLEYITAENGQEYLMAVNEMFRNATLYRPALSL